MENILLRNGDDTESLKNILMVLSPVAPDLSYLIPTAPTHPVSLFAAVPHVVSDSHCGPGTQTPGFVLGRGVFSGLS